MSFFAKQFSLINNSFHVPNQLIKLTENCLNTMKFSGEDITKIIQNLNLNKV